MSGTLDVPRGLSADRLRQVRDPATGAAFAPVTNPSPFTGSEALAVKVWPGDELATLATPSASWSDAATATYLISFAPADTSPLAPGVYRFETTATAGGRTGVIDAGRVRLLPSPGSGSVALAFTTTSDLLTYAPWLEGLQADREQTGFASEQVRATNRLIDALVGLWQWDRLGPTIGQPGFMPLASGASGGVPPSFWLREQLVPLVPNSTPPANLPDRMNTAANHVRPSVATALLLYDEVLEICARWAAAYVMEAQAGRDSKGNWWALARQFRREAGSLFRQRRFEVDLSNPQTGYASITIHGGAASLR